MIKRYSQNEINILANILKNDGVISVPTDTVYGICARINSEKAHDKLMKIKERPEDKSFPIMCADVNQIRSIAIVNKKAEKLIKAFMPGPMTIILNKNKELQNYVTNGKNTIAIRMATSEKMKELILKAESPLFMTSANKSGKSECNSLDEIEKVFPFIDGIMEGNVHFSRASTIIDCTSEKISILREGPISLEEILKIEDVSIM